ncbi:hypothetical protein ACFST9_09650 [Hymenobacter monticola]|uniref:hypothetical protein n=1 Tax=Hymenobacter monticola TaxID=1705399 RepID=UPI00293E989D|nr:hypothetical protein [Hymenobacter monticola]
MDCLSGASCPACPTAARSSIPSSRKSWLGHLTRVGITFRYTPAGPEGLIKGKKV